MWVQVKKARETENVRLYAARVCRICKQTATQTHAETPGEGEGGGSAMHYIVMMLTVHPQPTHPDSGSL